MRVQYGQPFFGWAVSLAIGYNLMIGAGLVFYAMSVLQETIVASTDYSVSQISTANAIFLMTAGFTGIAVGDLISRYDARYTICVGVLIKVLAFILLPEVSSLPEIYLCYVLVGIGYSMTSLVPATTLVARWFVRRRALALALTQSGLSLGGIILTPILAASLEQLGLEAMRGPLPLTLVVLMIPVTVMLIRPDPARMNLHADGDLVNQDAPPVAAIGMKASHAIRTRFFKLSALAAVFALLTQVGTIAHLYGWALERSEISTAAGTLALLALCSLTGRLICGAFLDRINLFAFVLVLYGLQSLAMLGMAFAEGRLATLAMTAVFGFTVGNILMAQALLVGKAFGVKDFPRILSVNQLLMNAGVAAGPIFIGLSYDLAGGYQVPFLFAAGASLTAAITLKLAGDPAMVMSQSDG